MAFLKVYKNDVLMTQLKLKKDKTYSIGRGPSCDLVLEAELGISRKHLKLYFDKKFWVVDCLSKHKELYLDGVKTGKIVLEEGKSFEVPPYRFEYSEHFGETEKSLKQASSFTETALSKSLSESFSERTVVAQVQNEIILKVANELGQVFKVFKLEGQNWVAGRDSRATIFIDVAEFSRQHFEIKFDDGNFMVRDLNSSNGTILNREVLSPMQWYRLVSGDQIEIVNCKINFEIRDPQFKEKLESLIQVEEVESSYHDQSIENQPLTGIVPGTLVPASTSRNPALTQIKFPRFNKNSDLFNNRTRNLTFLALPLLFVLYFLFSEEAPKSGKSDSASRAEQPKSAFEQLSPEQQKFIHNSYILAEQLFKERKYQLAKQEVTKIHQLIPYYYESKNLEKLTEVALLTELEQQRALAQEQERQKIESKIQEQTQACEQNLKPTSTMSELERCLQDVMALNPDHPKIIELKLKVEQLMATQAVKEERAQAYQEKVDRQKSLFHKAEVLFIETQYLNAIKAYDAVVNSNLPDPENYKARAKRKIASIQSDLLKRQKKLEREADEFARSNKLKEAILKLRSAVETNPNNEILKSKMTQLQSELKKQMQSFYQEGILEESVGEVESAKKRWMMIIERSLPEDEYFKKAQLKLRKYGI